MELIQRVCEFSGKLEEMELTVTQEEVDVWVNLPANERPYVQDQFPNLSADERAFILTGSTPEIWNDMMEFLEEED